jgi:hypothetical protein
MRHVGCIAIVMTALLVGSPAGSEPPPPGSILHVQVKSAPVKAKPLGFMPTVVMLKQGARVEVLGSPVSGYVRVRYGEGKTGFVLHASLVTQDRYQEIQETSVDAKEVGEGTAAYGSAKGWDQATEQEYAKKKNMNAQFKQVDKIVEGPFPGRSAADLEKMILEFAKQGRLGEAALVQ